MTTIDDTTTSADGDELDVGGDVESGTYACQLEALERFTLIATGEYDTPAGEEIPKLRWTWVTADGHLIEGTTSMATGPRSKMRAWMRAIGVDLSQPGRIKLSEQVGKFALVSVGLNDQGYQTIESIVAIPKEGAKSFKPAAE